MTAKQTVYITRDRTRAVPEGDKDAGFLLVKAGQEISEKQFASIDGAAELIGGTKEAPEPPEKEAPHAEPVRPVETREPEVEHRDPGHKRKGH